MKKYSSITLPPLTTPTQTPAGTSTFINAIQRRPSIGELEQRILDGSHWVTSGIENEGHNLGKITFEINLGYGGYGLFETIFLESKNQYATLKLQEPRSQCLLRL